MGYAQLATQPTYFDDVQVLESPSRTMEYSRLATQSTSFERLPSPDIPSYSHHVHPAIAQPQSGSHDAHMNEEEEGETEDLIHLATRAVRNSRKSQAGGDDGYAEDESIFHK